MGIRIEKILYIISIVLICGILLLAGNLIGIQNEREKLIQQEQAEVVTDIAIVNLDEGVYEDGKRTYYSTVLMDLEAENLISDNLESARQGILNGSYAAYILIPADFSSDTISINSVPQKAVLEFAVNPNLREDVSRLTMANIKNFEISLNTNMSYMYVQAILAEFHNVQDLSGIILENDKAEMERLMEIDSESLLVVPEYGEVERVEPEVEEVDFTDCFESNEEILDSVYGNYEDFIKDGEEAFAEIKKNEEGVIEQVNIFSETVSEIDISLDTEGNSVYENGLVSLETYLTDYDKQYTKQKELVLNIINFIATGERPTDEESGTEGGFEIEEIIPEDGNQDETDIGEETEDEPAVEDGFDFDTEIKPISDIIKENIESGLITANNSITVGNQANNAKITEMQTIVSELKTLIPEEQEVQDSIDTVAVLEKINRLEEQIGQYQELPLINIEDVYSEEVALEPFEKLENEVTKIPKVDTQEYKIIFDEQVIVPLNDEIENESQRVQDAGEAMLIPLEEYTTELAEFDLYSFYDQDAMNELMLEFGENIFQLEEQILETHGEYEDFVYDTVDFTNETMETMLEALENAHEDTAGNVNQEVTLAKEYRESMNAYNTDILGSFQSKLPYTRIGQLEYSQAYDFMVKPIKMSDTSIAKDRIFIWQDYDVLRDVLIIMIVCLCICGCWLLIIRMQKITKDINNNA